MAWVLADAVLELRQPFLAPWAALLVVHATVYRTFSEGAKQVAATVIAVLLAAGVGHALGLDTAAVGALIVVALVLGSFPWFGTEATLIATTGVVVLTTQAVAETRSMAHTLGVVPNPRTGPDAAFAEEWTSLLMVAGRVIAGSDADEIRAARQRLDKLVRELDSGGQLSPRWPVQGALIVNLRNILDAMAEVAVAHPLADPPRPLAHVRGVRRRR